MTKWRIFPLETYDGYTNMAFDEAILLDVINGGPPTIRLYMWKPRAISIGYNQKIETEIKIDECKNENIICVKRKTGGGAVFHGAQELTYSFVAPATMFSNLEESYRKICTPIIKALKSLKINVRIDNKNDLVHENRKISGNAQVREQGVILQHGTILWKPDYEGMSRYLDVSLDIEDIKAKVVGVADIKGVSLEELYNLILEGFVHGKEYNLGDIDKLRESINNLLAVKKTDSLDQGRELQWSCYFR